MNPRVPPLLLIQKKWDKDIGNNTERGSKVYWYSLGFERTLFLILNRLFVILLNFALHIEIFSPLKYSTGVKVQKCRDDFISSIIGMKLLWGEGTPPTPIHLHCSYGEQFASKPCKGQKQILVNTKFMEDSSQQSSNLE